MLIWWMFIRNGRENSWANIHDLTYLAAMEIVVVDTPILTWLIGYFFWSIR